MFSIVYAMAPGSPGAAPEGVQGILSFLPIIMIIGVFYLLLFRPQRLKQKEHEKMLGNLQKGDKVVTSGGIHGVVMVVKDKTVTVKVTDNVKLEFSKECISYIEK